MVALFDLASEGIDQGSDIEFPDASSSESDSSDNEISTDYSQISTPARKRGRTPKKQVPKIDRPWREGVLSDNMFPEFTGPIEGVAGISPATTKLSTIVQYFLPESLVQHIVDCSNEFAASPRFKARRSVPRTTQSAPLTVHEFWQFFTILVLMGIVHKSSMEAYWTQDPMLATPFFRELMPYDRFIHIFSILHFSHLDEESTGDKLVKIRHVFDKINDQFVSALHTGSEVSVDESLVLWRGNHSLRRYIPNKAARFGFKIYCLADSRTGYVKRMLFDEGLATKYAKNPGNLQKPGEVVWTVLQESGSLDQGYFVGVDNFYTDVVLFEELLKRNTYAIGTVRSNRRLLPPSIAKRAWKKAEKGTKRFASEDGVALMNWFDKKAVLIMTTAYAPLIQESDQKGKPQIVHTYNRVMPGVDINDQMKYGRRVTRKRTKKGYRNIFLHLLDIVLVNSYLVSKHFDPLKVFDHEQFRRELAAEFVADYYNLDLLKPKPVKPAFEKHIVLVSENTADCAQCAQMGRGRHRTQIFCKACEKHLCIMTKRNCFAETHLDIDN